MWIYITIATIIFLVYSINLTLKREHLQIIPNIIKKTFNEPILNEPIEIIEFNRNNIPIDLRTKLTNLLYKNVLIKTCNPVLPNGFEFIQIKKDKEKSLWLVEGFIANSNKFQVDKILWEFWILPGEKYLLKEIRPYSMKDNNNCLIKKVHGVDKNIVVSQDNLSNPLKNNLLAGISNTSHSVLELTPISNELQIKIDQREGRQPTAREYNQWILPKGIYDKNAFVTFTPDIINNNLHRTGTYDDLFSRTRGDPSFPRGSATGGV